MVVVPPVFYDKIRVVGGLMWSHVRPPGHIFAASSQTETAMPISCRTAVPVAACMMSVDISARGQWSLMYHFSICVSSLAPSSQYIWRLP